MYTEAIKTYYRAYFPNCIFNDCYGTIYASCLIGGIDWYLGLFGNEDNPDDDDFTIYKGKIFKSYEEFSRLLKMLKDKIGNN